MNISPRLSVGIIGGTGKTGSQFARLFRSAGFRVRVTGNATKMKNASLIRECDIILFALPLSRAAALMKKELCNAKRKDQLILDVSSLKHHETKAMLTAPGEVIGMHPLFGPHTAPEGESVILCPVRAKKETVSSLSAFFRSMKISTKILSPKEHDKLMLTIQVVPHLKSLLMAETIRSLNIDLATVLKTCTPTYAMEFNVTARFLDDHPDLYMPIIFRNPGTASVLKKIRSAIDTYIRIAETGDIPAAERRYLRCKKLFGPYLAPARRQSEACIRTLLSLTR